jgi:hypothetical protein
MPTHDCLSAHQAMKAMYAVASPDRCHNRLVVPKETQL